MRQVIIQDGDIKLNPERDKCFVCSLGLEHEKADRFFIEFDKDLREKMASGEHTRSSLIMYLLDNYSKTEITLALENFILGRVNDIEKGFEGFPIDEDDKDDEDEDPFKSIFNKLL